MAKLRKKGHPVAPVVIEGRAIVTTFWGKAWCDNLESYHDFENRLPRGRTYVRNGSVLDLQIAPREVTAMVSGSSIYKVTVSIDAVPTARWKSICKDCAGGIDSLVELLQGRLSQGVMERICRQGLGLFPGPPEIRFTCSCPDYASMCKHVAAVLYGVGARLDAQPELLFRLRAVDEKDLVTGIDKAIADGKAGCGSRQGAGGRRSVGDVRPRHGGERTTGDKARRYEACLHQEDFGAQERQGESGKAGDAPRTGWGGGLGIASRLGGCVVEGPGAGPGWCLPPVSLSLSWRE